MPDGPPMTRLTDYISTRKSVQGNKTQKKDEKDPVRNCIPRGVHHLIIRLAKILFINYF